jgi:putative ABC transport system permease protein
VDIIKQVITESMLVSFLSLMTAVGLASILLPFLREITDRRLEISLLNEVNLGLFLVGLALVTGLLLGIYPALFASSLSPIKTIKKAGGKGRQALFLPGRILVSLQFLCSTVLIIVMAVFLLQLNYTDKRDLGYQKDNLVIVSGIPIGETDAFKNELFKNPIIIGATIGDLPTMSAEGHLFDPSAFQWEGKNSDSMASMDVIAGDEDFPGTYGISMAAGRFFSREFPNDVNNVVLNQTAVRAMGLKDPIGKKFEFNKVKGQIIGVVEDYHTSTLRAKIRPTVMVYRKSDHNIHPARATFTIRISGRNIVHSLTHIEKVFKQFQPLTPFSFTFLEESLRSLYMDDRKTGSLIMYYGLLMLAVAGLGLVGLVALFAEQRTKEIGIRRVLGASPASIVHLLSRELMILVGISSFLAWPVGYLMASGWIQEYAYRIKLSGLIFAAASSFVLLFTFLTLSFQLIRAIRFNPVECLRHE